MDTPAIGEPALPLTMAAFPAVGCDDRSPAKPAGPDTALLAPVAESRGAGPEVLFHLRGAGVFPGQHFAPGFGPPEFRRSDFGGRGSVPADYVVRFSATGRVQHLGKVPMDIEHRGLIDFAAGVTSDRDGLMIITAPDGDELRVGYGGVAVDRSC